MKLWMGAFAALVLMGVTAVKAEEKPVLQTAIFAGGCFWCMHAEFEQQAGVEKVLSGYTGGTVENPTYEQVSSGTTGHVEAIKVEFDPKAIAYDKLLKIFWENVDPTEPDGQFCDFGTQYRAGIFYADEVQKTLAEQSLADVQKKLGVEIATFVKPAVTFYPAEDYHQSYYKKNGVRYKLYKNACGRDAKLQKIWGEKK